MDRKDRQKLSRKAWEDPEHRRLQSEGLKEKWEDPEYQEKISAARMEQQTPEMREAASKFAKGRKRDKKGRFL